MQKFWMKILGLLIVLVWIAGCAATNDVLRPNEQLGAPIKPQPASEIAQASSPGEEGRDLSAVEIVGDILWVRPIGILQTALLQLPAFVISLPVTIPLKKSEEARDFLVTYPYYYYIKRPIGEM